MARWLIGFAIGGLSAYLFEMEAHIKIALLLVLSILVFVWWKQGMVVALGFSWAFLLNEVWLELDHGSIFIERKLDFLPSSVVVRVRDNGLNKLILVQQPRCSDYAIEKKLVNNGDFISLGHYGTCIGALASHFQSQFQYLKENTTWSFQALYLGSTTAEITSAKSAYKSIGLYHLLVISGLHLSFLSGLLMGLLKLPLHLYYLFFPSAYQFVCIATIVIKMSVLSLLFYYVQMIGGSFAAQRALAVFTVVALGWSSRVALPGSRSRLMSGLVVQTILFPIGLMHPVNLLCWLSYAVAIHFKKIKNFRTFVALNCYFMLISVIFFGYFNPIAIVANFLFSPIFLLIFALTGISQCTPTSWGISGFADSLFIQFNILVGSMSEIFASIGLHLGGSTDAFILRFVLCIVLVMIVLSWKENKLNPSGFVMMSGPWNLLGRAKVFLLSRTIVLYVKKFVTYITS